MSPRRSEVEVSKKRRTLEEWVLILSLFTAACAASVYIVRFVAYAKHEDRSHISRVMVDSLDTPAVNSHIVKVVRDSLLLQPKRRH